jgi:drug/metabolite transporter (DMT)-like permease
MLVWGQSHHGGGSVLGDLFVASGVLASAANGLIARRNAQTGANPLVTASWQLTSACCVAAGLLFLMPGQREIDPSYGVIGVLLYLGLIVSAGVYVLSNYAYRHLPVARASLLGCLTAPLGAVLSAVFLGTQVTALDAVAVGVVVVAVSLPLLARWRTRRLIRPRPT